LKNQKEKGPKDSTGWKRVKIGVWSGRRTFLKKIRSTFGGGAENGKMITKGGGKDLTDLGRKKGAQGLFRRPQTPGEELTSNIPSMGGRSGDFKKKTNKKEVEIRLPKKRIPGGGTLIQGEGGAEGKNKTGGRSS